MIGLVESQVSHMTVSSTMLVLNKAVLHVMPMATIVLLAQVSERGEGMTHPQEQGQDCEGSSGSAGGMKWVHTHRNADMPAVVLTASLFCFFLDGAYQVGSSALILWVLGKLKYLEVDPLEWSTVRHESHLLFNPVLANVMHVPALRWLGPAD